MSGRVELVGRSVRLTRALGRGPRVVALAVLCLLAVAGARAALAGPDSASPQRVALDSGDLGAQGFAQAFARSYLTWDSERPERHERQLASFIASELEPGAGLSPPKRGRQQVVWTAALGDRRLGRDGRLVTVAAQTTNSTVYLAVSVRRDPRGFLLVPRYPAVVGPPVTSPDTKVAPEREVEQPGLRVVAERAVSNYLAGQRDNLLADLDPGAVVSLPGAPLRVESVESVTKAGAGRVAVAVRAADAEGAEWTLRYELAVVRREERWNVRSIQINPTSRG